MGGLTKTILRVTAVGLIHASLSPASAAEAVRPEDLVGLWGSEVRLRPLVSGQLVIDGRSAWRAQIAGYGVEVTRNGHRISFVLPNDEGEFRGRLSTDSRTITGHWIQPQIPAETTLIALYPYASPVTLSHKGNSWTGEVRPLEYDITLYLSIQKEPDGSIDAFLKNPQSNIGVRRPFKVSVKGTTVVLSHTGEGGGNLEGEFDAESGRISVRLEEFDTVFDLRRRDRSNSPGFYPRTPEPVAYEYRQPLESNDGWQTASLQSVGMDAAIIESLIESILRTDTRDPDAPYIHSILIARHNKLVLEEYFYGFSRDRPHDLRSAGKSLTSVLFGVAMLSGANIDAQTPVYQMFPEYDPNANPDPRKSRIRVHDLLTMTSGLACDDGNRSSPGCECNYLLHKGQPDWYKHILDLPVVADPGTSRAVYCTGGINLVGGIIRNATSTWTPEFFHERFAVPLNLGTYYLNLTPQRDYYGGGGSLLRPRDFIKIGQLYLSGGVWHGRRVVGKDWIAASLRTHAKYDRKDRSSAPVHGYGYAWHVFDWQVGSKVIRSYVASGNGGQNVTILPELDMVVAFTGGNYDSRSNWSERLSQEYVIPAASPR